MRKVSQLGGQGRDRWAHALHLKVITWQTATIFRALEQGETRQLSHCLYTYVHSLFWNVWYCTKKSWNLISQKSFPSKEITGNKQLPGLYLVTQSCPTLCNPMDCSPSGFSVHGILQARILKWVAMPSFRGSSRPRDRTCISYVSCIGRQVLYH